MGLSPESFSFVADMVRRRSAIQLLAGKEYLVESRLLPLAREQGLADVDAYVVRVRAGGGREADLVRIVEALATNETSWFRDASPFLALASTVAPAIVADRGAATRLRVWSAACSTGQEPYSIAMTLADCLPPTVSFEILATDLSEQVLTRARAGRYTQLEVNRGMPAPMLVRHLVRSGPEWEVVPELRAQVTFQQHNLLDAPPAGGPFDVVFLRNVLIYFDLATKRAILRRVRRVLRPGGALLLGGAETTIGVDDDWVRTPVGAGSVYHPVRAAPRASPPPLDTVPPRQASAARSVPQPFVPPSVLTRGAPR
ncbi:CheR family methyltransferase [Cellulomonas fengjieae]|uniref:protein-glutamate O-methyltransferase n=1 Tax=Cellulomonas fengjieae TaxID=2819978 RepID=A0ABS3SLN9_9CELL|nr:protein-glutamate O-methyltransferase CheR [Cellulomonas fengjieae]MBO3086664.1 protein-glutamate O-methyltransferase CheR [Cellulomonas fengjieae]QVI66488.1 protein-glutamate O-methyltransferase CheR [Cellulomonas fengjieae]